MAEGGSQDPVHLIVVQHGLHGGDSQFTVFEDIARERWGGRVLVHRATANCQYGRIGTLYTTSDGVNLGGQRLAKQTMEVAAAHPTLRTYSLVGNSLGGLYVRYAAAVLEFCRGASPTLPYNCPGESHWSPFRENFKLEPLYFASFVSPHCGIIDSMLPIRLGARAVYRTGSHLLLSDSDGCPKEEGGVARPLLEAMADADHIFVKALASFRHRFLFANMRGDFQVPYCTAAIVGFHPQLPAKEDGREPFGLVATHRDSKGEPPVPEGCQLAHQSALGRNMVAGLRTLEWIRSDVYYNEWSDWLVPPLVHSSPAASGIHFFSKDRGSRIIEWFFDQLEDLK